MYLVKLSILILIAVHQTTKEAHGKNLTCYKCSNDLLEGDLKSILPCEGFKPNSTYEIECESDQANLCLTKLANHEGNWKIEGKSCGVYLEKITDTSSWDIVAYTGNKIKDDAKIDKRKQMGYKVLGRGVVAGIIDMPYCTRKRSSSKPNKHSELCRCDFDLCNSVETIKPHGTEETEISTFAQLKRKPLKCYKCSNDTCLEFEENPTYEIDCSKDDSICFMNWILNGSNWVVTERGCMVDRETPSMIQESNVVSNYSVFKPCYLNTSLLRSDIKMGDCYCKNHLCNSKMLTEHRGIISEKSNIQRVDRRNCYGCLNNNSCSGFQENATYQINCENEHSTFCFTRWNFNGTNWMAKERGCAGLMKKNKKLTLVPHRRGQNLSVELIGYQTVSREVTNLYGDVEYCGRVEGSPTKDIIHGCSSNLCNGKRVNNT